MEEDRVRQLQLFLEGEAGHNGNVLATTFVVKLHKLLNLLHRMERLKTGEKSRRTEYEIIGADKYNPTVLALKPVPKVRDYNPAKVFDWSIEQIETIANGRQPDAEMDFAALQELAEIAARPKDGAYNKFWLKSGITTIVVDEKLARNAQVAANTARAAESPRRWHTGIALGEVTGDLRAVLDEDGEQEFVIHPPVGPDRIVCKFPADKRSLMNSYLFKVVTVSGKLHYGESSPFPTFVEMADIRAKATAAVHLLDLRGVFEGLDRPAVDWASLANG